VVRQANAKSLLDAGVAICALDETKSGKSITPVVIQKWPGTGETVLNKVPTTLTYKAGNGCPRSWGSACPPLGNIGRGMGIIELFKFFLDEKILKELCKDSPEDAPGDIGDVRKWFTDFLSALHKHIEAHLEAPPWGVSWHSTKIEYIFALPTLWKNEDALIDSFKDVVKNAGFNPSTNCSVTFRLTEAEASAVYTAEILKRKYRVRRLYASVTERSR
jgi:hypothetical protein